MKTNPQVRIVGGDHDGITGTVNPKVIELGFLVQNSTDRDGDQLWHGYWATGAKDLDGRHIFSPRSAIT